MRQSGNVVVHVASGLAALALALAGCSGSSSVDLPDIPDSYVVPDGGSDEGVWLGDTYIPPVGPQPWSYDDPNGPDAWGTLSLEYTECGSGIRQSPIDIPATLVPSRYEPMEFAYAPSKVTVGNDTHGVQFRYDAGSALTVGAESFELKEIHFHARAEHTVAGKTFPLELHLVHEDADGTTAVVALLVEEGAESPALAALADHLAATEQEPTEVAGAQIDAAALLPAERASWRYLGSRTTPPCTVGVRWFVMVEPLTASAAQIGRFTAIYDHNYRPTQPIDDTYTFYEPHFSYDEAADNGPARWGELSPWWETCGAGTGQSPVDIPAVSPSGLPPLTFAYQPSALKLTNNGHTAVATYDPGSTFGVDGRTYTLKQVHAHAASEHTLAGLHADAELHLVHEDATGALAVVAVLVKEGAENAALAPYVDHLPISPDAPSAPAGVTLDADALLPAVRTSAFRYQGSLTTPPCTEGVSWFVMPGFIEASSQQLIAFSALFGDTFRPTRPLNDRVIASPAWSYGGESGPDQWAALSSDWATCGAGTAQSPIDIPGGTIAPAGNVGLQFILGALQVTLDYDGESLRILGSDSQRVKYDGVTYTMVDARFHAPSEHTIDGVAAPLELQTLFRSDDGRGLGYTFLFEPGPDQLYLMQVVSESLPTAPGQVSTGQNVDTINPLIGEDTFWIYDGSSTTPPCAEDTTWFVTSEPLPTAQERIDAITALIGGKNRPVQPLNGRLINGQ